MFTNRLKERGVHSCKFLAVADLKKYTLKFHKKSTDGSGKCNAYYTGHNTDKIIGVIFDIKPMEKPNLDKAEGLCHGYHETPVSVHDAEKYIEASMYEADNWAIDDSLYPYTWYKDFVVQGAKEHNLPETYIKRLEAVLAKPDPNNARERDNRHIIDTHGGWPIN